MLKKMFRKKEAKISDTFFDKNGEIPRHLAIIMDGNGRWANKKHLPRIAGHKRGMENVKKIARHASDLGIDVLTLYAFSTENWKRPEEEVAFLMNLPVDFFDTFVPDLIKKNVRVQTIGYIEELPEHTQRAINNAVSQTKENTGMILNFALNYGSRAEITTAVQRIVASGLAAESITEKVIEEHLMTSALPEEVREPELIIRTSGEERISNFLLWQAAYSEFFFTEALWPDFDAQSLEEALAMYQTRERRFGGLKK